MAPNETKRLLLDRLFPALERHPQATQFFLNLAQALAEQSAFPDLAGWEDSAEKLEAAERAVRTLRDHLKSAGLDTDTRTRLARAKEREELLRAEQEQVERRLADLKNALTQLTARMGTQQAGYEFQTWFYELMALHEVTARRPYVAEGRQIDGTITIEGTTYIVELKFTLDQTTAADVDSLAQKVAKKADNTMGIMVSMSGYSSVAVSEASGPGTKLLLLDYSHIMHALDNHDFSELVARIRRNASQTGKAFLPVTELG